MMEPQCAVCDRHLETSEYDVDVTDSGLAIISPNEPVIKCASCDTLCCKDCISPKNADLCGPCGQCDGCSKDFAFDDLREWTDNLRAGALSTRLWLCRDCRKARLQVVAA